MRSDRDAAGRTPADRNTGQDLETLAWLLDSSIRLPGGFRIGLDALLGLVPVVGDAAGVVLSAYIIVRAAQLGVPRSVLLRMLLNVGVEFLVGLVPLAGDIFDAAYKANLRNVQLLAAWRDAPATTAGASRRRVGLVLALVILCLAFAAALSALLVNWLRQA